MKIPSFRRFDRSDYKDAPEWADKLFNQLNKAIEVPTMALQGGLTIEDNEASEPRDVEVRHDTFAELELQDITSPSICLVGATTAETGEIPKLFWFLRGEKRIKFKVKFETDPGKPVSVRLLFKV